MNELSVISCSHKTAPIAVRERLATPQTLDLITQAIAADPTINESVIVSTCNRFELYLVSDDATATEIAFRSHLSVIVGDPLFGEPQFSSYRNCDVARHLFRVASGLESMVMGEAEIQGQTRRALQSAQTAGSSGPVLNNLFRAALACGGRVRAETQLSYGGASVASVAVSSARQIINQLDGSNVVLVGSGEMAELTARSLSGQGAMIKVVAGRHYDRALSLAERFNGQAISHSELPAAIRDAAIVISSTSSPHCLIGSDELATVMEERAGQRLLMIDLAVPRDIDPNCNQIDGVTLIDIDSLQTMLKGSRVQRLEEVGDAVLIVERELTSFARWLGALDVAPVLESLRMLGDTIARDVVRANDGKWESASPADRQRVDAMVRSAVNRLLHRPTISLRGLSQDNRHVGVELLRELFSLSDSVSLENSGYAAEVVELRTVSS